MSNVKGQTSSALAVREQQGAGKLSETILCKSLQDLTKAALELLTLCKDDRIFAFYGEMGAGKTTFIKALCKQLGVEEVVSSPTFAIVNEYKMKDGKSLHHFDFYRVKNESEVFDFGFEEYLYSGNYCFMEWPEKINKLLPDNIIKVLIRVEKEVRIITIGQE